jgi:hypothetical protein
MAKHRWLRRTIGLGIIAGAAYAAWRAIEAQQLPSGSSWEPQPFPFPPQPRTSPTTTGTSTTETSTTETSATDTSATDTSATAWLAPIDGACPGSHPVKAKLASGIYHVPGGQSYDRTTPDRCYVDAVAAEQDGLRASKR